MNDIFRLDNKVAVVIGAGSGIGQAAAIGLARQGARVVCADVRKDAAQETAAIFGGEAVAVDIANGEDVHDLLRGVARRFGNLHVVVSTPGINVRKTILNYSSEEFDRVIAV